MHKIVMREIYVWRTIPCGIKFGNFFGNCLNLALFIKNIIYLIAKQTKQKILRAIDSIIWFVYLEIIRSFIHFFCNRIHYFFKHQIKVFPVYFRPSLTVPFMKLITAHWITARKRIRKNKPFHDSIFLRNERDACGFTWATWKKGILARGLYAYFFNVIFLYLRIHYVYKFNGENMKE